MLHLSKMSQDEFDAYRIGAVVALAREIATARDLTESEGMRAALASFESLFPDGRVDGRSLFVFNVLSKTERVGTAIFGVRHDKRQAYGYVWEIAIHPPYRGKGLGEQTMLLLEAQARELGLRRIGLNVFGHNRPAVALYEKLGYQAESMILYKNL